MVATQSWLRNLLTTLKKPEIYSSNDRIAVLTFEASSLMTKLVHLWQSLTDKQVARLRDEITNSVGVKKLVSEADDYIASLICAEMTENLAHLAKSVARLSQKCNDPILKSFQHTFIDFVHFGADPYDWQLSWKKMEKKVKKMEQFIIVDSNLFQEMEMLADLEQTYGRVKSNDETDSITIVEYEKKLTWKRQLVKHLKESSLWSRTYDYTLVLLARSVFTIHGRIGNVFGVNDVASSTVHKDNRRGNSTIFIQTPVYPFENPSVPRANSVSVSGPLFSTMNGVNFHSGPLRNVAGVSTSNPAPGRYSGVSFYSAPLGKLKEMKTSPFSKAGKNPLLFWQKSKDSRNKIRNEVTRIRGGDGSLGYSNSSDHQVMDDRSDGNPSVVASRSKILNPPPDTLGFAALALHYANLIIFIEKLVASPHLIGNDARDDLYNMLPARIRSSLRSELKPYSKSLTASVYDTALAAEWNEAILRILDWLAPLAHNMIKWQSERSFEHRNLGSRTNVLLVQTLFLANQEKTEAAITQLLLGLNYIWRFGREIAAKSLAGYATRTVDEYLGD